MRQIYIQKLNELKDESGMSFASLAEKTGISDSTLCRWFQGKGTPSIDDLEKLFDCLGGSMEKLFADVGRSEMHDAEKVDYKGTNALLDEFHRREQIYRESCDQQIKHQIELRQNLQQSFDKTIETITNTHNAALEKRDQTYERSVSHLKGQIVQVQSSFEKLLAEKDQHRKEMVDEIRQQLEAQRASKERTQLRLRIAAIVAVASLLAFAITGASYYRFHWDVTHPHLGDIQYTTLAEFKAALGIEE